MLDAVRAFEEKPRGWWFGIQPGGVMLRGGKWVPNPMAENVDNLPDGYYEKLIPGKDERDGPMVTRVDVIVEVQRAMDVGVAEQGEPFLDTPPVRFRVVLAGIDHLDPMYHSLFHQFSVFRVPAGDLVRLLTTPARMVPEHEATLSVGFG